MIRHIVMWTLKDEAEGAGKAENALKMKAVLEGLREKIPEILHIEVGINISPSPEAYDVVLYSEFDTARDVEAYLNHPAHLEAGDFVKRVRIDRRVVDYEV